MESFAGECAASSIVTHARIFPAIAYVCKYSIPDFDHQSDRLGTLSCSPLHSPSKRFMAASLSEGSQKACGADATCFT